MLTAKALKEFEALWRKHNPGKPVDKEALRKMAMRVLNAVAVVYASKENN